MAGLVIGSVAALFFRHHHRAALRAHHDLVLGRLEIVHLDETLAATRSEQGGLIDQIRQVGAGHAGRAARQDIALHVRGNGHLAHMHHQYLFTTADIRQRHHNLTIKATRAQQRWIEHVGTVGRGDHDHAAGTLETIHLDQQRIQGLLALIVTTT